MKMLTGTLSLILSLSSQTPVLAQAAPPVADAPVAQAPETEPATTPDKAPQTEPTTESAQKPEPEAESPSSSEVSASGVDAEGAEGAEAAGPSETANTETANTETPPAAAPLASATETGATQETPTAAKEDETKVSIPSLFKPGKGFIFRTADDQFEMQIRVRVQFDNVTEISKEYNANNELETQVYNTFGIRRARLQFAGHMWGEDNSYKLELAVSPRDLGLVPGGNPTKSPLLSFYTEHTQLRDLSVRIGQYKLYYNRQRVISSGNLDFVDRSLAQSEFNLDRDIGMHLFSKDLAGLNRFKYYAGVSIAEGRDAWETEYFRKDGNFSYQLLGRLEYLPFGIFKDDYSEGDLTREDKLRLSIGAAYAYLHNGTRARGYLGSVWADGGTVDYQNVTADAVLKYKGFSTFGEFFFRSGQRTLGSITTDANGNPLDPESLLPKDGVGYSLQAGYVLPTKIPVNFGARYSAISDAGFSGMTTSLGNNSSVGGTVGFFPGGHSFKLQADYFHLWGDAFDNGSANRVRLQLQVAY